MLWLRSKRLPFGKIGYLMLKFIGVEIPLSVTIGTKFKLAHWAYGLVIHGNTIIGNNVKVYPGVTIGRADVHEIYHRKIRIVIEDGVILCAGAKILCKGDELIVRRNSVIGANAVLTQSTCEGEVWGGIPARKIR